MPDNDTMTIDERRKYLKRMYPRYRDAQDRQRKGALLTEMESVTGLHRKHLIRLLTPDGLERTARQRQRGVTYDNHLYDVLRVIAETLDYICAERLTPAMLTTAEDLARHGELVLSDALRQQLGAISVSTVRRHLARLIGRRGAPRRLRGDNGSEFVCEALSGWLPAAGKGGLQHFRVVELGPDPGLGGRQQRFSVHGHRHGVTPIPHGPTDARQVAAALASGLSKFPCSMRISREIRLSPRTSGKAAQIRNPS